MYVDRKKKSSNLINMLPVNLVVQRKWLVNTTKKKFNMSSNFYILLRFWKENKTCSFLAYKDWSRIIQHTAIKILWKYYGFHSQVSHSRLIRTTKPNMLQLTMAWYTPLSRPDWQAVQHKVPSAQCPSYH